MRIIVFVCLALNLIFASGQKIDDLLKAYHQLGEFNGIALVAGPNGVIFQKGYGLANLEWQIPNQIDTKYRIGSITKQFTASLILSLVEEGRISEDSKLSDLLPWYRKDTGSKVTLKQLLNHTSGIDRSGIKKIIAENGWKPMPLKEEVEKFCSGDLEWDPGSKFAYNNAGYLILSAIIEEITSKTYEEVLEERIIKHVGMNQSGLYDPYSVLKNRAEGYTKQDKGFVKPEFVHSFLAGSAGGLYSTID